ncbi:hypothetical protein GHT06_015689 [Daphnia sinensis]|uniref:Uncharacterized protein n=1 Tax=Daphnia sinensis TaxID=1820382 RepID=A0AAD5PXG0_9CRUS|nr:hypothetical protein GHT06_015689 [Daphnia sinensis]
MRALVVFNMASHDDGASKTAKAAVLSFFATCLIIIIAFSTNSWLETDGTLENPKFIQLGLWNFCLRDFKDVKHLYDRVFNGCRHVLDEEYHIIDWLLRPPFFIAVQLFFTLCFMLMLVGIAGTLMYVLCFTYEHQVKLLRALAWDLTIAAFCGTIAVITFGALGDSRDWMPDFEHNFLSWSFGLAVVGTFGLYLSATLFFIEAKVQAKKHRDTTSQATFSMEHKV